LIAGATVKICGAGPLLGALGFDSSCSSPVASGTTDDAGSVSLPIPTALARSGNGAGLNRYLEIAAQNDNTTLF
jgi:hypothetical protein